MKIVFMGTPDFARESLKALVEEKYDIKLVVTNPDKPKGRGMKMISSPVKEYALEKQIEIIQPLKVKKNDELIEKIKKINPDIICVVAYGKIIPKEILEIPRLGCINVHGSLLPKYRGAAPIQWSVLNGDKITGITTMYMDVGMDTGDIILEEEIKIEEDETTGELWDRMSKIGGKLLVKTLEKINQGTAQRKPQDESQATYAPMLTKEMGKIDWDDYSSIKIKNLVRGLNPKIGAYTFLGDNKIKIWKVKILNDQVKEKPGTILESDEKKGLIIQTKDGIIEAVEIQAPNSRKMNSKDYLRGNKIKIGEVLK